MLSEPYNKPPAEWTTKYWQWIYSQPRDKNPLKSGSIYCNEFICLPCTGGGEDCGRKVTLSGDDTKKDILVPVFASEYSTAEVRNASDEKLRSIAREMSIPVRMEATLDTVPLIPYYIESKPFNLELPTNHSLQNENSRGGTYRAVSCGYWNRLKPLPKGKHIIKFGGTGVNGFFTSVSYKVNVT